MRFTTFILTGALAVFASAQTDPTTTGTGTALETPSATGSLTPAQSSAIACIDACDAGDVSCQAKCIAVPDPSASQANATNECVGNCNQGNGSVADTQAYSDCVQNCIDTNYFTTSGTPAETTASTGTASDSSATATGSGSNTASGSSTATGSSASATSSDSAAMRLGITSTALMGLLAAAFAL